MWLPKAAVLPVLLRTWPPAWNTYPVFIKICFIISMVALIGILLAMADIYIWRTAKRRKDRKKLRLSEDITRLLMNTVVMEPAKLNSGMSKAKLDTRPFLKLGINDKDVRSLFVCELINYRNYFTGAIAARVRQLYLDLSLDKEARKLLYKKNWETKSIVLSELFKMDIEVDNAYLLELTHHKNRYIRGFARLSMIKFTKGDPLAFLRQITEPISQWEEFEIFLVFQQKENYTLSSLEGLIAVDREPSVVSLCLKLAVYFKDLSAVKLIMDIIQTPDLKLRAEAIASLGKLEASDAEAFLISIYGAEPQEIRLVILTALGMIRSGNSLEFLENEFISSDDFETKMNASDALIKQYPLSQNTIDKLMNNSAALEHRILSHSLNPLINAL
ncbi:MAG: HEAT repeat domain-containing protein [Bacteroidota bacterium]